MAIASRVDYHHNIDNLEATAVNWDGITRNEDLHPLDASLRHRIADAAKSYDWLKLAELLSENPTLVNCCRPGGQSLFAPLHQAAHGGASESAVNRLIKLGAWRTLHNALGERPIDIAEAKGHTHLIDLLQPILKRNVPIGVLTKIQYHFHNVIRGRAEKLILQRQLRLPELGPLLELDKPEMWFAVPGMYGGFSFRLEGEGATAKLISDSWCRIGEGSEQTHQITSKGSILMTD